MAGSESQIAKHRASGGLLGAAHVKAEPLQFLLHRVVACGLRTHFCRLIALHFECRSHDFPARFTAMKLKAVLILAALFCVRTTGTKTRSFFSSRCKASNLPWGILTLGMVIDSLGQGCSHGLTGVVE